MHGMEGLTAPGAESPKLRLTAGKVVPGTRYKIVRWLGEGGMGVVYEAEHVDIARRVALKILRFDLSTQPRMVKVFKDEAKAAGRLGSQYLVEIFDFGELRDGRMFFAMELLDGHDLVPPDEDYSMAPSLLIPIMRQVCKGLGVAHAAGVVHRDVKPENIITAATPDQREQVKIVDFGISAMLAVGPGQEGGAVAGTPHYMAPEQILGQPFDGRLDIYALGCTAYELLTGVPPFDADTVDDLLHKQVYEEPMRPRDRRPDANIPKALDEVIMKCLAKDPAARFTDTVQLEAALCEAQISARLSTDWDDLPVPDLPNDPDRSKRITLSMPSRHARPHKRSWMWPIVAAVSTAAAAGLGVFLMAMGPTDEERSVVEDLEAEARQAASRDAWVIPDLEDPTTAYERIIAIEAIEGSAESLADDVGASLRKEFSATLVKHGDRLKEAGPRSSRSSSTCRRGSSTRRTNTPRRGTGLPPSLLGKYLGFAKTGEWPEAEKYMIAFAEAERTDDPEEKAKKLEALYESEISQETDNLIDRMGDAVVAKRRHKRRGKSRQGGSDTVAVAERPAPPVGTPAETKAGTPAVAETEAEEIVEVEEGNQKGGGRHRKKRTRLETGIVLGSAEKNPKKASELASDGMQALRSGQRGKAESLFNQAIASDRSNAKALMGLSDVYFDTGRNQKALIYAEKAVRASPGNRTYRLKLGDAYFKVLRYKDALKQYEEAKKRGSSRADQRIAKVKARMGG